MPTAAKFGLRRLCTEFRQFARVPGLCSVAVRIFESSAEVAKEIMRYKEEQKKKELSSVYGRDGETEMLAAEVISSRRRSSGGRGIESGAFRWA